MAVEIFWYSTVIFAIWGSSLGGIAVPGIGLLYPYRILMGILFLVLLLRTRKGEWNLGKPAWFTVLPVLAYMALHSLLSLLWAHNRLQTAKAILNFLFVGAFLLAFRRLVRERKHLDRLLTALSANFAAILLVGVYEAFSNNYLFRDLAGVDMSWRTNAFGLSYPAVCFTNPNDLAFVISMTVPLMLYVLDEVLSLKRWQRALGKSLVVLAAGFVMMQTCSRLGYVVFFLVTGLYFALQLGKSKPEAVLTGLLAIFLALSASGVANVKFDVKFQGKLKGAEPITEISPEDASTSIRLTLLRKGLRVTRDTWGLGAGAKNSPAFMKRYTDIPGDTDSSITDYHFFYMELLADYGVIPLTAFLVFQAGAFFAAVRILRKRAADRWLALCVLPGAVGFVLASGNGSSSMFVFMMWMQFALWSMATGGAAAEWLEKRKHRQIERRAA